MTTAQWWHVHLVVTNYFNSRTTAGRGKLLLAVTEELVRQLRIEEGLDG